MDSPVSEERLLRESDELREGFLRGDTALAASIHQRFEYHEKQLDARFSSLKAWGIAALVGGQTIAALVATVAGPARTARTALAAARWVLS